MLMRPPFKMARLSIYVFLKLSIIEQIINGVHRNLYKEIEDDSLVCMYMYINNTQVFPRWLHVLLSYHA